jgi:hypothetical protein
MDELVRKADYETDAAAPRAEWDLRPCNTDEPKSSAVSQPTGWLLLAAFILGVVQGGDVPPVREDLRLEDHREAALDSPE